MATGSKRGALLGLALVAALLFGTLGVWQVQRLAWKTALIERVETRVRSTPVPAPAPRSMTTDDAYRAVRVTGRFRHDREAVVQAVTDLGPGSWVMTPLETDRGFTVLVNRGFVPATMASDPPGAWARPNGIVQVSGLVRLTEPKGGFLRTNQPAAGRWFSRDVHAIAEAEGVTGPTAPYFIDAAAEPGSGWPRGGLTVVRFTNHHLIYALTWFGLAAMALFAAWRALREPRPSRGEEGVDGTS